MARASLLAILALLVSVQHAAAAITIIHAAGIDPDNKQINQYSFYDETKQVIQYCRSKGLTESGQCDVYIDSSPDHMNLLEEPVDLSAEKPFIKGEFDSKTVLGKFKTALLNAKSGDEIVFSLVDHGAPLPGISKSCILAGKDHICDSDIKQLLKLKKPGVKVFIIAHGCFSGGFTESNNKEVCVLAAADRHVLGHDVNFWKRVQNRHQKEAISLTELRRMYNFADQDGGGFASSMIRDRLCKANDLPAHAYKGVHNTDPFVSTSAENLRLLNTLLTDAKNLDRILSEPVCSLKQSAFPFKEVTDVFDGLQSLLNWNFNTNGSIGVHDFGYLRELYSLVCQANPKDQDLCNKINQVLNYGPTIDQWSDNPKIRAGISEVIALDGELNLANRYKTQGANVRVPSINEVTAEDAKLGAKMEAYLTAVGHLNEVFQDEISKEPKFKGLETDLEALSDHLCFAKLTEQPFIEAGPKYTKAANSFPDELMISESAYSDAKQCEDTFTLP